MECRLSTAPGELFSLCKANWLGAAWELCSSPGSCKELVGALVAEKRLGVTSASSLLNWGQKSLYSFGSFSLNWFLLSFPLHLLQLDWNAIRMWVEFDKGKGPRATTVAYNSPDLCKNKDESSSFCRSKGAVVLLLWQPCSVGKRISETQVMPSSVSKTFRIPWGNKPFFSAWSFKS